MRKRSMRVAAACAWPLVLLTFSAPGRIGGENLSSLDTIAIAKVVSRLCVMAACLAILRQFRHHPRTRVVTRALLPFGAFLGWAVLSASWSALKAVSLGQAMSLTTLLLLCAVVGVLCEGPQEISAFLRNLCTVLFLVSLTVCAVDLIRPDLSGLNRVISSSVRGSMGLVHPTSAGATAALGLVILAGCRVLWGWGWTRILLWPGVVVHLGLMLLAQSRTALFIAAALLAIIICKTSRLTIASFILAVSLVGTVYIVADPDFVAAEKMFSKVSTFIQRGEKMEQMQTLTGRTYLWESILRSFSESPVIGHGYFVTSKSGFLPLPEWHTQPDNTTAHNVYLQVLVTTGVVGASIFLWALVRPISMGIRAIRRGRHMGNLGTFLVLIGLWFAITGMVNESFMGGLQPESVVFFLSLGLSLGAVATQAEARLVESGDPGFPSSAQSWPDQNAAGSHL